MLNVMKIPAPQMTPITVPSFSSSSSRTIGHKKKKKRHQHDSLCHYFNVQNDLAGAPFIPKKFSATDRF